MAKVELIVSVTARDGKAADLKRELQRMLAPTHAEAGCEFYRLYESEKPGRFFFHELWTSQSSLDAHVNSPHFQRLKEVLPGLIQGELDVHKVKEVEE